MSATTEEHEVREDPPKIIPPLPGVVSDARSTVDSAITDAFAETAQLTGLRSGEATDVLREALVKTLFYSPYRWATGEYFKQAQEVPLE